MARRSAESGCNGKVVSARRSDRFLDGLKEATSVTFVSHVHPDPDSLGSMMGLAHLVETCLGKPTRLTRDGLISRAENRAMVELLDIDLVPIEKVEWHERRSASSWWTASRTPAGTPSIPTSRSTPSSTITTRPATWKASRSWTSAAASGATCSLVTSYLMEQSIARAAATWRPALLYGIETELSGYPREASPLDDGALLFLYPLADKDLLARIRNARLPQSYFECMLQALQSSFIYDRLIISWVNELPQPELAAEVVDFLIRFEEDRLGGLCRRLRGQADPVGADGACRTAGPVRCCRQVVGKLGRAGGHDRRAGGIIPLPSTSASAVEQMQGELRRRLLKALHIDECRGQRLVSRREMLQNLQG